MARDDAAFTSFAPASPPHTVSHNNHTSHAYAYAPSISSTIAAIRRSARSVLEGQEAYVGAFLAQACFGA
jgi:hypothetical protein